MGTISSELLEISSAELEEGVTELELSTAELEEGATELELLTAELEEGAMELEERVAELLEATAELEDTTCVAPSNIYQSNRNSSDADPLNTR